MARLLLFLFLPCLLFSNPLDPSLCEKLNQSGWQQKVGKRLGIWVSIEKQRLFAIKNGRVVSDYPCSTGLKGAGSMAGSEKTPLGWHAIAERFGDTLPSGAILKERAFTGKVWKGEPTKEDLILTRILWLKGLEAGKNAGHGIDTHDRYIYIHGTPEVQKLGSPASHGCIRLASQSIIELYPLAQTDTCVLITLW